MLALRIAIWNKSLYTQSLKCFKLLFLEAEHRHGKWKSAWDLTEKKKKSDSDKKKKKRKRKIINPLSHFATAVGPLSSPIDDHEEDESTRIRKRSYPNRVSKLLILRDFVQILNIGFSIFKD